MPMLRQHGAEERPAAVQLLQRASQPVVGSPSTHDSSAEPVPNQPGSMIRDCDQLNTHGMARRSEIVVAGLAGRRAAADVELAELLDRGGRPEPVDEAGRLVHQRPVGLLGAVGEVVEQRVGRFRVVAQALDVEQARLQRGGDQRLQVAAGQVGFGVLGRDHLALLGDPQRPGDRARRLGPDRLVAAGRHRGRRCRPGRGRAAAGSPRRAATSTRSSSARYSAQLAAR